MAKMLSNELSLQEEMLFLNLLELSWAQLTQLARRELEIRELARWKRQKMISTTWNELFCSCLVDVSIWWQMFIFFFLCPKRWFQINFRTVRTHFSSIMTLNNWKMIAEKRSYIFRWRSRFPSTSCLLKLPNDVNGWNLKLFEQRQRTRLLN